MVKDIVFPIFKLRAYNKIETTNNVTYVHSYGGCKILDNKNLSGKTLGSRRIKINKENLYKLNYRVSNIVGLIGRKAGETYIDNTGKVFKYKKTKYFPISYHKIKSVQYEDGIGAIIHLYDVQVPIIMKARFIPNTHVALIRWLGGYLIYELCDGIGTKKRIKI